MRGGRRGIVMLCLLLLLGAGGGALSAELPAASDMILVRGDIAGVALSPDGETPLEGLPVRLWDVGQQKVIYQTQTDANGAFRLSDIPTGRCIVFVGRAKVDLQIANAEANTVYQQHDIMVVVPRGMLVGGGPRMADLLIAPLLLQPPDAPTVVSP